MFNSLIYVEYLDNIRGPGHLNYRLSVQPYSNLHTWMNGMLIDSTTFHLEPVRRLKIYMERYYSTVAPFAHRTNDTLNYYVMNREVLDVY